MSKWKIKYYKNVHGKSEISDFIEDLSINHRTKVLAWIDILKDEGPTLPRPYSDFLRDGIHELRIKISGNQLRILYFFVFQDYIILTNSFIKNQNRVPENEIIKALKIKNEFNDRFKNKHQFEKYLQENEDD